MTAVAAAAIMKTNLASIALATAIVCMKEDESILLSTEQLAQTVQLGEAISRLRLARRIRQQDAALRAGLSRPTASKIERGDPGRTLGQVIRYLGAIAPGMTLAQLVEGKDPFLLALAASERRQRVRELSAEERRKLDF